MGTCAAFAGDDLLAEVVLERMLAVLAYRKFHHSAGAGRRPGGSRRLRWIGYFDLKKS